MGKRSSKRRNSDSDHHASSQRSGGRRRGKRKMRLFNIVPVRFRTNFLKHDYNAQELQLKVGEEVVVETSRGPAIARVEGHIHRRLLPTDSVPRVIRKANESDLETAERNEEREENAYRFALERIRARKLPMKLIRAQYMHDGSKIVFYFSADGRIDFRDLVKDLAHRFRTRIEMHQIGVRDGARMLGGIGPCGRELCCSTFLESFAPVSIRMAKEQGLTLNPKKVSGMCGRLMCCLVYEQALYKKKRRTLPRPGTEIFTDMGPARILSVDVINARVTVELADTNRKIFPVEEIAFEEPSMDTSVDADPAEPAYMWDDLLESFDELDDEATALENEAAANEQNKRDDKSKSDSRPRSQERRRRRARGGSRDGNDKKSNKSDDNGKKGSSNNSSNSNNATKEKTSNAGDDEKKSRGRRRRRRRGGRNKKNNDSNNSNNSKSKKNNSNGKNSNGGKKQD